MPQQPNLKSTSDPRLSYKLQVPADSTPNGPNDRILTNGNSVGAAVAQEVEHCELLQWSIRG